MKDLLGREVQVGQYICYALTADRSANLAVYQVKEVSEEKIKARKINASYGRGFYELVCENGNRVPARYTKSEFDPYRRIEMTEEEKQKVDSKTSSLSMPERIFILDDFSPEVLKGV